MGTSRSASDLATKMTAAAYAIGKVNRTAVQAAAQTYKDVLLVQAARDTGGDLRLSKWGRRGIRLGVGYDVRGYENATAAVRARPQGPWKVLEHGSTPHVIAPRRRRGRRGNGALVFPDGKVRSVQVQHPGSQGKETWSQGVGVATPRAVDVFGLAHKRALVEQFK